MKLSKKIIIPAITGGVALKHRLQISFDLVVLHLFFCSKVWRPELFSDVFIYVFYFFNDMNIVTRN